MSDTWSSRFQYGHQEHLEAIGITIVAWNEIEFVMFMLYRALLGLKGGTASSLFYDHSNSERFKLILAIAPMKFGANTCGHLEVFRRYAVICNDNRNFIAHSSVRRSSEDIMANKIRKKDLVWTDYKLTLSQLRQAAEDADRVAKHGKSIVLYALAGETNEDGEPVFRNPNLRGNTHFLAALPKTPAQPVSLTQPPKAERE
ncbi:hypothetical protein [Hyphomonas oceanitis]|uniref:Uncharacterized protein n=1 Tax=Hyphomonas oceanitis SCH89 TaxID=1280953 RepID=A0A059G384_9PROT|nr:hypothetical protein [Hyphomonas oceanitis]KDA00908.1 hypothetical protein HOC_18299 [Hyphomonas oceanitis SCH89]